MVLLHASFLAVRGLQRAATASIGWNPDGLVMAATELGLARYSAEQVDAYLARVVEDARALPGVASVTASNSMPLHIDQSATALFTYPASEPERGRRASFYSVAPGYFATLQIPLREGRDFTAFDTRESPQVAIVNRAVAERLFGGSALGKQVTSGRGGGPSRSSGWSKTASTRSLSASHGAPRSSARCRSPTRPRRW